MIDNMKEFILQLVIIVVVIVGSLGLTYSTPLDSKDSQEGIVSNISPENKELHQKLKEGCEIDAYIKQGDSVCEIKIRIKEDFKEEMIPHSSEFERAINVEFLKDCFPENGELHPICSKEYSQDKAKLRDGDRVVYKKYKDKSKKSSARHLHAICRRLWTPELETKLTNYGLTYEELFRAVEELIEHDESKLGKWNLVSKKRVFKEITPDEQFLLSFPRPFLY